MAKTLLIVGAGQEQVPAYQLAKDLGFIVIGSDHNPDAPALKLADQVLIASTRDSEETKEKALERHRKHAISGVMTIANDVPYTVAYVAQALGLRSISLEAARNVSDKLLMKQCFQREGVSCPWFQSVDSAAELSHIIRNDSREKYVLKPVDGRGARGVLLIDHNSDARWSVGESKKWGDSGRLILEEYVEGIQLSTESFLINGKCFTPAIAERNYSRLSQFAPNIIEDGGTIPAPLDNSMKQKIDHLILSGAKALGISEGIIKGDLVIDKHGNPIIIELAARLSGGWFATHQIIEASGVNLVKATMLHALGEKVSEASLVPTRDRSTAIRYWFPPHGKILTIDGEDELQKVSGLLAYGFFRKPGDIQPRIKMHPDRFGYALVSAESRGEALERIKMAMESIQVKVAP